MVATQLTMTMTGGGPYGLRLTIGESQLIMVDKVRKNGKADEAGLKDGDVLVSVNGRSCQGVDSTKVAEWIDNSGSKLTIQVIRGTTDVTAIKAALKLSPVASTVLKKSHEGQGSSSASTRDVTVTSVSSDFTISAPSGVEVQQNADKSFTVTIGMPFALDIGQTSDRPREDAVQSVKHTTQHMITLDNYKGNDTSQQDQQQQENDDAAKSDATPQGRAKRLERILSEGSGSEPSTPSTTDGHRPGKKLFVDSAFYDDPEHKYPTVSEQIQLARQVAMSVISPANFKSKGHRMFMKSKERSVRWTTGLSDEEKAEIAAKMAAAKAAEASGEALPMDEEMETTESPVSSPLGMPSSVMFAPRLPTDKDTKKMDALSNEELEKLMQSERKTTHTNVSPQVCFSLVDDLRSMKGKGGKLFAKRQAKAETWDKPDGDAEPANAEEESGVEPTVHLTEKIKTQHKAANEPDGRGAGAAPANRLKEMIEVQRAAMTPWDAVAKFGTVDKAFEHLENLPGRTKVPQNLIDNLQQQQRRKEGVGSVEGGPGAGGRGAVRPKSTIGCVGRAGEESAESKQSKIEALGGNPNAAGLASAMKASLAASRGGGFRSVKFKAKAGEAEAQPST